MRGSVVVIRSYVLGVVGLAQLLSEVRKFCSRYMISAV